MKNKQSCKNCCYYNENQIMYRCRIFYASFNYPIFEIDENNFYCNLFKKAKK